MKIGNIYKVAGILILYIVLQGRSAGPGTVGSLQVTGAPGSTGNAGTCGNTGCHTQGSFNPSLSMSLFDNGNLVAKYEPGKTYTLRLTISPVQGIPAGYGFQAVALNSSNQQAGDWGAPGTGRQVVTLGGRKYIEHSTPAANGVFELPWIAPASGTGTVTFYAASLASNLNTTVSGDGVAKNTLVIQESGVSNVSFTEKEFATMNIFPNPVQETLNVQIISRAAGLHQIRLIDVRGAVVQTESVTLQVGTNQRSFPVGNLAPGLYLVQLCGDGHLAATRLLKQ